MHKLLDKPMKEVRIEPERPERLNASTNSDCINMLIHKC